MANYELIAGDNITIDVDDLNVEATVSISTLDDVVIGGTTPAAGTFTTLTAASLVATTADVNGGTIDDTVIGGTTPAAATFTTATATTFTDGTVSISSGTVTGTWADLGTVTTVDVNGGTIDNTTIGGVVPSAVTGTTLTTTAGPVTGKATTADGSTDAIVAQDSSGAEVFAVDSDGNVTSNNLSNPNILINSNLADPINQRGVTAATVLASTDYTVDRWKALFDGTSTNFDCDPSTYTGTRYILTAAGSGQTYAAVRQAVENYAQYLGKTVTLSIRAKVKTGATVNAYVNDGAASNVTLPADDTFHTSTVTHTCSTGSQLLIDITMTGLSSADYFEVEWIKLEEGPVATPYVIPDPTTELARCQRYYQRIKPLTSRGMFGNAIAGSISTAIAYIPITPKRSSAYTISYGGTFSIDDGASNNPLTTPTLTLIHRASLLAQISVDGAGGALTVAYPYVLRANNDTTAYIEIIDEL